MRGLSPALPSGCRARWEQQLWGGVCYCYPLAINWVFWGPGLHMDIKGIELGLGNAEAVRVSRGLLQHEAVDPRGGAACSSTGWDLGGQRVGVLARRDCLQLQKAAGGTRWKRHLGFPFKVRALESDRSQDLVRSWRGQPLTCHP